MAIATATSAQARSHPRHSQLPLLRNLVLIGIAVVVLGVLLVAKVWPFNLAPIVQDLEQGSDSKVQVQAFHRTYFPSPGCVLDGVNFFHGSGSKPLISIQKLTIQGSYLRLLERHVNSIQADGMHVFIPASGREALHSQPSTITIGEITANGAILEFESSEPGKGPLRFDVREASIHDVGWAAPLSYRVRVHNPLPPGEVTAEGKFGVWNPNDTGETPISGEYKFENADLGVYGGIGGTLASVGKFSGKLEHIDISGTTDTPDFNVLAGYHSVRLITEFSAYVDATRGDTFLKNVDARFRRTRIHAVGSIAKSKSGHGKTALISLETTDGRIEDILDLFVQSPRSPMSGAMHLRASVEIPSGKRPFLEKIKLRGGFGVGGGEFSNPSTQQGIDKLSAGARGEKDSAQKDNAEKDIAQRDDAQKNEAETNPADDPETVMTDLGGEVLLSDGLATFTDLTFGVPGASARMHGTYNVIDHKIDLHGQMHVLTKMSNTTNGAKALLLKVMDPFFKKRKHGEMLPVKISGTYEKPSFGLDLKDKKAEAAKPPRIPKRPR